MSGAARADIDRLETDRLLLRPFEEDDGPAYRAIRLKPGVTRFLPSHTEDPAEAARRADATLAAFREAWARDGYGPWAVVERAPGRLVGHLGLRLLPDSGETELLFMIDPEAQGRGYATEGGRAALAWGFDRLALPEIVAFALSENAASIAVLGRLGMTRHAGLVRAFGLEVLKFALPAGDRRRPGTVRPASGPHVQRSLRPWRAGVERP